MTDYGENLEDRKMTVIKYLMLALNIVAVLFVTIFIFYTTRRICNDYVAREFINNVKTVPWRPVSNILLSLGLMALLIASFVFREFIYPQSVYVEYGSLGVDFALSIVLVLVLNFNYNGILFWVFANVVAHAKGAKGRYMLMFLAVLCFLFADYQLLSIYYRLYSINDYIQFYAPGTQSYLLGVYNIITSLNMILFIIYCIFVIQEQRGTIKEVNMLYEKLEEANEDLQKANVQLQDFASIQEKMGETKERNRLAREIHDTLGHTLTGISAGIDACITMIDASPEATKKQLEVISDVTREGIKEIRSSVNELRPDALGRLGLEYSIRKMVTDMNQITNTKVYLNSELTNLKFDEDEENAIYRIIQEGITNSIRHGQASHIWITMKQDTSNICLTIKDDGVGCKDMKSGFGTRHMAERVGMLNGTVTFDGSRGFTVKAVIPIRWGEEYD